MYLVYVLCTAGAAFLLYAVLMRKEKKGVLTAAAALPAAVALALLLAKATFVLLMQWEDLFEFGDWSVWLDFRPRTFSFVGGAVGACLGVWGIARLLGTQPNGRAMDRFAAAGALLAAGLRMAEAELGMLGAGRFIETPAEGSYLILAVYNNYGEPMTAVFVWEALTALVIAALSLYRLRTGSRYVFEKAAAELCVCQILLESMRSQVMRWGFVFVEQLLCAVILMILTLRACALAGGKGIIRRYWPAAALLALFGGVVLAEFLRQRIGSEFMVRHGAYLMMAAILCVMLILYHSLLARRDRARAGTEGTV